MTFKSKLPIVKSGKTIPERLLPWTALLGAMTGAIFGAVQFLDAKDRGRVDRVFAYVNEFKTESLLKNHVVVQNVSDSLTENYKLYREELARDSRLSSLEKRGLKIQFYYDAYVLTYQTSPEFKTAMDRLSLFYEELAICAQEKLCDAKTARSFFQSGASAFLENTRPIICHQRQVWNDVEGTVIAPAQQRFFKQSLLDCRPWIRWPSTTAGPS